MAWRRRNGGICGGVEAGCEAAAIENGGMRRIWRRKICQQPSSMAG